MADPELLAHREWLGFVQPIGVVVSAPALVADQAYVNRNVAPLQQLLLDSVEETPNGPVLRQLPKFVTHVLRWNDGDLVDAPAGLECALPEYGEALQPTYAVRQPERTDGDSPWLMLVKVLPTGIDFDTPTAAHDRGWHASPEAKFERLLRETQVPTGVLLNGTHLRLVYAPRGETSGYLTFPVAAMTEVAGRPILAGLEMLLCGERLFTLPEGQRLPAILIDSRRYQNEVSTRLAGQVLAGLYELLRGLQAADDHSHSRLLQSVLRTNPDLVYEGLLAVLLRLVFLLYAEDRDLMPADDVYTLHYSVGGLFDRLRSDAGRYPDTMDLRYGAWTQMLSLFRIVFDGVHFGSMRLPPRHGHLFDPDRFPFLEGRPNLQLRVMGDRIDPPLISDGVVWRVLQNLVVLDGDRLSYRSLDVEQIGSVYETMMGFRLEIAAGRSLAIKPAKPHGAPIAINVDELLATPAAKRAQWVREHADQKLTEKETAALAAASSVAEVEIAIERKIDRRATPTVVPAGAMILQPNEERRRSGSFYTPRSLTEPIVRTTLRPIIEGLGDNPTPKAILDLKVCDPAMGSGAFLVEACRQLADTLVDAWHAHDAIPPVPPDSDELLHARRLVAHRCLYGVDLNPIAVDLAKLSLWLTTLARDHAFTFLDHALRCGDSLVGLTADQIVAFHWAPGRDKDYVTRALLGAKLDEARRLRALIRDAGDEADVATLRLLLREADDTLDDLRLAGDLVILAFFEGKKTSERETRRDQLAQEVWMWQRGADATPLRGLVDEMRHDRHVLPFHWQIEFPEVFDRGSPGFDAFVGNPPFMAGKDISGNLGTTYLEWLRAVRPDAGGQVDIVAFFFRTAYELLKNPGTFGLLATNTIRQGDTRSAGLRFICNGGGIIYSAVRRIPWSGSAAVVTSAIHIAKGMSPNPILLDGRPVEVVTAFLFHRGGNDDPERLRENASLAFSGYYYYGAGFTFDDANDRASPLSKMHEILSKNSDSMSRLHPIIGGEEMLNSPTLETARMVIDFESMTESEARHWPELMEVLEELVKPERAKVNRERLREYWWQFGETRPGLRKASRGKSRLLMHPFYCSHLAFGFVPSSIYIASPHVAIVLEEYSAFAVLQARIHEVWARFFASSFKDDLRYTPSDCFETFPFPANWRVDPALESAGKTYYEFRAELMIRSSEGLTQTYTRFDDPNVRSPDISRLRELHASMDRAALETYGWSDLEPACEFLLDYEDESDSRRRKPWRYRWPDNVRDEILARLLALNAERAEGERLQLGDGSGAPKSRRAAAASGRLLFEEA